MNYSHLNGSPYHVGTCPDCGAQTGDNFNYQCPDCELVQCPSCEEYFKRGVLEPSGLCTDCDKIATELEFLTELLQFSQAGVIREDLNSHIESRINDLNRGYSNQDAHEIAFIEKTRDLVYDTPIRINAVGELIEENRR